jgi:hypothetical protein
MMHCTGFGYDALKGVKRTGFVRDITAIGRASGMDVSHLARSGVFVGSYAGSCAASSQTHPIGEKTILIGRNCGKATSSFQTISSNVIMIGCTGQNAAGTHPNTPAKSILLGEGASATGSDEGRIVLGSVANHTSCRISGLLLDGAGNALDCANSYHVFDTGSTEVRHIVLHPSMCMNDSGHSSILQHPASSGYSAGDPMSAPDSHRRFHMGIRSDSEYQQLYITLSIPEHWIANGMLVNFTSLSNGAQVSVPV